MSENKSFILTPELKNTFELLGDREAGKLIKEIFLSKDSELESMIRHQVKYWLQNRRVWERFRIAAAREAEVLQWYSRLN